MVARAWGEDTPTEPESMDEGEEGDVDDVDVTPLPISPPYESLPPFDDIIS
jgi:hypothetical protein